MSQNVAPWLQGLDDAWETPANYEGPQDISSISNDANSPANAKRSLSGLPSIMDNQSPQGSTRLKRNPLAQISNSNSNTFRRNNGTVKMDGTRSVSGGSDGSVMQCGTVQIQPRAKSSSPKKQQETLEWQKRLMRGQVGYGDQTDLFGPSALENIFAPSGPKEDAPKPKGRMAWLQQGESPMPSSPPVWSNNYSEPAEPQEEPEQEESAYIDRTENDQENIPAYEDQEEDEEFDSNPFDLQSTDKARDQVENNDYSEQQIARDDSEYATGAPGNRSDGPTQLSQEDFSPVYISKHTSVNGKVDYAAFDSHLLKQYNTAKAELRASAQEHDLSERSNEDEDQTNLPQESSFVDGPSEVTQSAAPDLSLSENLPTGTPPVASLGRHVELQRGGYSQVGSFKQRLLSPSPSRKADSAKPSSKFLSPVPSEASEPIQAPSEPATPRQSGTPSPAKPRSSGSPLKLFGAHDTFTNNRLLRRMSQLDPAEYAASEKAETSEIQQFRNHMRPQDKRIVSDASFGSGQLNGHGFNAEITITSASDSDQEASEGSPGSAIAVPGSKAPQAFRFEQSSEVKDTFKLKRRPSKQSPIISRPSRQDHAEQMTSPNNGTIQDESELDAYYARADSVKTYEKGKRPPNSPFKDPTPKRRRTLHASEMEDMSEANNSFQIQLQQAASSRKRKDARHGETQNVAAPDVLAQRRIARPRNSSVQDHQQRIEEQVKEVTEEFVTQEPEKLEAVIEQIEESMNDDAPPTMQQQAEAMAAEVAAYSLRVTKPSGDHGESGERKRSVTTQDFFNEAVMVMNLIRSKARPQSGLGSVEESDESGQSLQNDDSMLGVQSLRVSRPPSREGGGSGWRQPLQRQTDARVVSHLRKFQERDDTEFIAESLGSIVDEEESYHGHSIVVDEHSNIRIIPPPKHERHQSDDQSRPNSQRSDGYTLHTQGSEGPSTGRTAGSNCSKKSDNVGTLAPDAVAHLIGEQVGTMAFDKELGRWVRVKSPEKKAKQSAAFLEPPSQVTSDDDPFQEISDLPVDEQVEYRRVSSSKIPVRQPNAPNGEHQAKESYQAPAVETRASSNETVISRPVTRDNSHIRHNHSSSVQTRYTAFASSQREKVETRATSWSDEELARLSDLGKTRQQPLAYAAAQAALADRASRMTLEEQSGFEDSQDVTFQEQDEDQSVDITDIPRAGLDDVQEDTQLEFDETVEDIQSPKLRHSQVNRPFAPTPSATRQMSLRRKTLKNKFQAGVREQSELSLIAALPGDRTVSLSLSVSRPVSTRHPQNNVKDLQSPSKGASSFILSDLPDFTVHEDDHERPSERALANRLARYAASEVNDRYALAVKDLIKTLTDVKEDEPYWEDVKQLDLREKRLGSLFGLQDFCDRVQDMDVSNNALLHMSGAPSTIRRLVARSNQLSSLTSWSSLMNLQYLDISGNALENLCGLSNLVHLRELVADDNEIDSLDGVLGLDGLLKLRLRRNKIQDADFRESELDRLEDLDLSENQIASVTGVNELKSLVSLNLGKNPLTSGFQANSTMPRMENLTLQGCQLETLDVGTFPQLRNINVDDNRLLDIQNIEYLKHLDSLSMRRQDEVVEGDTISLFEHPLEARTVLLSGNSIPSLSLTHTFLNLQHLELASVGLQELPTDFGLRMPNLRTLNLNFNSIQDVRPLLNIQKLDQLSVCGNRLHRLRKSVATFARMASLRSLDLRDNPLTQGFYLPTTGTQTSLVRKDQTQGVVDEDLLALEMELAKHNLPSGDLRQDTHHQQRLDEATKLKRRVYELLLAKNCQGLDILDGMAFDRPRAAVKDEIFDRLVELGILRKSQESLEL